MKEDMKELNTPVQNENTKLAGLTTKIVDPLEEFKTVQSMAQTILSQDDDKWVPTNGSKDRKKWVKPTSRNANEFEDQHMKMEIDFDSSMENKTKMKRFEEMKRKKMKEQEERKVNLEKKKERDLEEKLRRKELEVK